MAQREGGALLMRALKNEGVRHIFSLSGTHIQSVYDGCIDEGIEIIDTRHEQGAVHMADAWARVTGQPGVAVLTAGPGVTDGVTGVAVAQAAASPAITIGGRLAVRDYDIGATQDLDHVAFMQPLTKWARTVYDARRIPEYVAIAFRQALSGQPGPVFLDVPADILRQTVEEENVVYPQPHRAHYRQEGDPSLVAEAAKAIMNAQSPIAVAGSGVWWSQAGEELQRFIEAIGLPLITTAMARGAVPDDHPLCLGGTRVGMNQSDVILILGTRFNNNMNFGRPPVFPPEAKVIQIDIDPREIGRNRSAEFGIVGDLKAVLAQLTTAVLKHGKAIKDPAWLEKLKAATAARRQRIAPFLQSDAMPIHPLRMCQEIADFVDRDATIIADGGDLSYWAALGIPAYRPGRWLEPGPLGCIGVGIPMAVAAQLANRGKQVVVVQGDGSFGFNCMEIDTAVRHKLPIVVVIGNDAAWGMIKHGQEISYGPERIIGTELGYTRYEKIVEALGGYGEFVDRPEEIRPALQRAFATGGPACINVKCDPTVVSEVTKRMAAARGK